MIVLLAVLILQERPLTVGDTLWAVREVRLAAGDSVRAAAWELEGPVQLLGRPEIVLRGNQATVRYPLVAWEAGDHVVDVPGPVLTRSSGAEDTLPSQSVTFRVASVLPAGVPDSQLAVQPPAVPVTRGFRSPLPAIILGTVGALLLLPLHWWWRRRGKPRPRPPVVVPEAPDEDTVRRWADAGERRTVAGLASLRLREAIARQIPTAHTALDTTTVLVEVEQHQPHWPVDELRFTLLELDGLRFAPERGENALELYLRGRELTDRISGSRA
jgi:hypothetical protein